LAGHRGHEIPARATGLTERFAPPFDDARLSIDRVRGEVVRAAKFAAQPDPLIEERGLGLVGRIVTRLLGQCHAFVGRAMIESGPLYPADQARTRPFVDRLSPRGNWKRAAVYRNDVRESWF
jgi:hypothetical protein